MPANALSIEDRTDLAEDFELYAPLALKIRPKAGKAIPLKLNSSQRIVHERLERQLAETGQVRAIILKGRQQGISTYVGARFYHKITHRRGFRAFILTHEDPATSNLFEMTKRFHDHCLPALKPVTGAASAKELTFPLLDGGYKVATAGGNPVGRSSTIQLFHGSEYGFWPNAEENLAGVIEAIPDEPDTEAILESTANEPGDAFHKNWRAAKAGRSRFIAIFLAWFMHEEYRTPPPAGWTPPKAFREYQDMHGLDDAQTYWAWLKNRDMAAARALPDDEFTPTFRREYPATDEEAFESAGDDVSRIIPRAWVKAAMARWVANKDKPKGKMTGMGADVAQGGPDRSVLAPVRGVRFDELIALPGTITTDGPAVAAMALQHIRDGATIAIDLGGGWGGSAFDHLKGLGMKPVGVNPAEKSDVTSKKGDPPLKMRNERSALHWEFREALDPTDGEDVELPPDDELLEELSAANWTNGPNGVQVEAKEILQKAERLGRSPDKSDAVLLGWRATKEHAKRAKAASEDTDDGAYSSPW